MELYPWQSDFLECKEPVCAWVTPRQSGKSEVALLKANQDITTIIAPYRVHLGLLRQRQELLEREGFDSRPQLLSNSVAADGIPVQTNLLIIEEATMLTLADLTYYYSLFSNEQVQQLIFMGTPHQNNRNLADLCIQENIPVHRTRQAHWHSLTDYSDRLRQSMTDTQWMNQALGMYEPEIERLFTRPGLKEFDLCELISLPPTP